MADLYSTSHLASNQMGNTIDGIVQRSKGARRNFERRWYDNNFFDDGYHFRYLSRQENKIIDLADRATLYSPLRAIPKASRQIRGIANLLLATDPIPIIYPENISSTQYPPTTTTDPQTGQPVQQPNPELEKAQQAARDVAKKSGHWLMEEFKRQDLTEKLAQMVILACKHGISYLQVWPDAVEEAIKTQVFDAFDVFVQGTVNELQDSPYLIKVKPRTISEIKADERFDPEKVKQISPDNRYANSEIKDSYMRARYGGLSRPESAASVLEKEAFLKEYLDDDNMTRIKTQRNGGNILKNRKKGDVVIRHTFVAGNIEILDEYLELTDYPFVDFRMEPGPLYGVPMIERFIPANKSLDIISSRLEKFTNVMLTGIWSKRKGEDFEISNSSNGQVVEYSTQPPAQVPVLPIPNSYFEMLNVLQGYIEEQGVTVTTLGKLPKGVKANAAIETLKETEYANLVIAIRRLKSSVKRIAEKFLDLADNYFVTPQTTYYLEKGEPNYFDIIGKNALEKRNEVKLSTPEDVVPVSGDYKVDIQVEDAMAYTQQGKKESAQQLMNMFIQLAPLGLISPDVVKVFVQKVLELYAFGDTSEIIDAMEETLAAGAMNQNQISAMKATMGQVIGDFQKAGVFPSDQQRITENKIGVAQAATDLNKNGIPDAQEGGNGALQQ